MTKATEKEQFGWHWLPASGFIQRYGGEIRLVQGEVGLVLDLRSKADVPNAAARRQRIEPCEWGLHFSDTIGEAYQLAPDGPSSILTYVKASGKIVPHNGDKYAASRREILAVIGAKKLKELSRKTTRLGGDHDFPNCLGCCFDSEAAKEFQRLCVEEAQRQMGTLPATCPGTVQVKKLAAKKRVPAKKKAPIKKATRKPAKKPVRKRR